MGLEKLRPLLAATVLLCCACSRGRVEKSGIPVFRDAAEETGLRFLHNTGATGNYYFPEMVGPGAALFDYDDDGDLDVYLVQGNMLDPKKKFSDTWFPPPAGWTPGNRLFRNELIPSGRLRFTDVTAQAGVGFRGYGMGAAVGDYDNDGDLDLYVTNFRGSVLYRNNGDGAFTNVTGQAGVSPNGWPTSAAFFDYDRDGDLDLFVTRYVDFNLSNNVECHTTTGARDYCGPQVYRGVPDKLYRNEGNGRFTDVSASSGIGAPAVSTTRPASTPHALPLYFSGSSHNSGLRVE